MGQKPDQDPDRPALSRDGRHVVVLVAMRQVDGWQTLAAAIVALSNRIDARSRRVSV
jgi:hypothetical protein